MRNVAGLTIASLCSLLIVVSLGLPAAVALQDEPSVTFEFSPARQSYEPEENFTVLFTITNTLAEAIDPSTGEPVNTVKFLNLSVHFSWMAPNVYSWTNVSATSSWLGHGEMEEYVLNLTVPANASSKTYSYFFAGEYQRHTPWGNITAGWGPTITYHDFVVSVQSDEEKADYVPLIAAVALGLAIVAIAAVIYLRRSREKKPKPLGTVESLGLAEVPQPESFPVILATPGERFPIEKGFIYLVKEKRPNISFAMYNEATSHGAMGMLVVREHPNRLKQLHEFESSKILWLTRRVGEDHIDPTELSLLSLQITKFVESTKKSVVLLEGLEYLITQNDFEAVLRFVNHLHDFVLAHDCAVILVVDSRVLATRELALLERSTRIVEPGEASIIKADKFSEELAAK